MSDDMPTREQLAAAAHHDPNTCIAGCRDPRHGDQAYSAEEVRIAHLEAELERVQKMVRHFLESDSAERIHVLWEQRLRSVLKPVGAN